MGPITENGVELLEEIKAALSAQEEANQLKQAAIIEEKRLEKVLAQEEKAVADEISATIKKRRDAVVSGFDQEMASYQEKLRQVRTKREQARQTGMKERIREETTVLRAHSDEVKGNLVTLLKQNRVPQWCNSFGFFALFMPKSFMEWVTCIVVFFLVNYGLPVGLNWLIKLNQPYLSALVQCVFFAGYFLVFSYITAKVKVPHNVTLVKARNMRSQIRFNRKKIHAITSAIRKDKNEEYYNLDDYNYSIAKLEAELEGVAKRKAEGISTFDAVTKQVITDELTTANQDRLTQAKSEWQASCERLTLAEEQASAKTTLLNRYTGYLEKDMMQRDKIDELIKILQSQSAQSITEAVSQYKNKKL